MLSQRMLFVMSIRAQLSHAHLAIVASRHARRLRVLLNLPMVPYYDGFVFDSDLVLSHFEKETERGREKFSPVFDVCII